MLALVSNYGVDAKAGDLLWNLTDDGKYVVQVHEANGQYQVFLKNSSGSWATTNPQLLTSFKNGLVVNIDGKSVVPTPVNGIAPVSNDTNVRTKSVQISMFNQELVHFTEDGASPVPIGAERPLSVYDIRQFATNESYQKTFSPILKAGASSVFDTDLHTHLAGHLPFDALVRTGYRHNVEYPINLLDKLGIKYPKSAVHDGKIHFQALLDSTEFKNSNGLPILENAMTIEKSHIRTFVNMEDKYLYRGPITKNIGAFRDMLWDAARASAKSGVKYTEQSISNVIDPDWLNIAQSELPKIEKETGVKMRFIVGLWRHSDPEWNLDEITRVKRVARASPYIVGVDFMGHETNSSQDLAVQIKAASELKKEFGSEFQVRVHAGENPLNPSNVRVASELGATRVGHGLYIEKDQEALKLDSHTEKIDPKVLGTLKTAGTIIEINPISNQALNNLSGGSDIILQQFRQFKAAGIPVVFGTDGIGMYGADHREIERMLGQLGFTADDFAYVKQSENKYMKNADAAFEKRKQEIAARGETVPSKPALEAYVDQQGRHYTPELATARSGEGKAKIDKLVSSFASKGIKPYDSTSAEFRGMKAIDVSGGSMSQFASLAKEGRTSELQINQIQKNFSDLLLKLDPKKVFFITGGTQFGVEKILHEEVSKFNASHPNGQFKILGVLPAEANAADVFGPSQEGITHYKIAGKGWADFAVPKLELLEKYGGAKIAIAGKMFVADEFRAVMNARPNFKVLYQDGPIGASSDLAKEHPAGAYKTADELIQKLVGNQPSDYLTNAEAARFQAVSHNNVPQQETTSDNVVSKDALVKASEVAKAQKHLFVKDAPVLGYQIKSDRFEDIPEEIRAHLGAVDRTKYTPEYLRQNIGSVIALQMNGDNPDFYIIGKDTFTNKYAPATLADVTAKNSKYFGKIKQQIPDVIDSGSGLVPMLKTTPTEMIKMSDLGYPHDRQVTIESPWGEQTKPAGQDAYLVWDDGKKQFYMVNSGEDGNPLSYVPSKVSAPSVLVSKESTTHPTVESKESIVATAEKLKPKKYLFVKDAPVLGYRIKSDRFEDIPEEIRAHLGAVDRTKYTPEYLRQNIGSVIALQMNGDKPDFYIIGKDTFTTKYKPVSLTDVSTKNSKYFGKVKQQLPNVVEHPNSDLISMLKTTPTEMVRMSDLGYPHDKQVTIESPWGEQTKPANQDAYLVWDEGKKQFYMVNAGADGHPLSYIPAKENGSPSAVAACMTKEVENFIKAQR